MVRAARDGRLGRDDALLVVRAQFVDVRARPDARGHDEQFFAQAFPESGRFHARGDYAVAAQVQGPLCAVVHQIGHRTGHAEIAHVLFAEAGEHGHGQDLGRSSFRDGRAQDRVVAVHRKQTRARVAELGHGQLHGLRDVEELEVHHDLVAAVHDHAHRVHARGQKELQADLIIVDMAAQPLDPPGGVVERGHVQGEDDAVGERDVLHGARIQ